MKVLTEEFDRFWADVLGDDWYVEDEDLGYEDGTHVDLEAFEICWQGKGEPQPNAYIKQRDVKNGESIGVTPAALFRRWKKAQTTTTILATFDVPKGEEQALLEAIKALGGKVKK